MHTEKEVELAKRYLDGDCNEIQLNYIIHTEGMDGKRVEKLIDYMAYHEPINTVVRLMIVYMISHFAFCLAYSLGSWAGIV